MVSTRLFKHTITYFIQGELTKRIKIGKTNTYVSERIRNMQTGSPDRLIFVGVCFGQDYSEARLHKLFDKYRLHGEWFQPDESIIRFIKSNCFMNEVALYQAYEEIHSGALIYIKRL